VSKDYLDHSEASIERQNEDATTAACFAVSEDVTQASVRNPKETVGMKIKCLPL